MHRFGKEPLQSISRISQHNEIIEAFEEDYASQQIYMITGVRGMGKTVFITSFERITSHSLTFADDANEEGEDRENYLYHIPPVSLGMENNSECKTSSKNDLKYSKRSPTEVGLPNHSTD